MQLVQGRDKDDAIVALKKQFKLKKPITITPTGEVRVPGVTDDPDPPSGGPPAPPAPLAPVPPPEPEKGSQLGSETPAESIIETAERLSRRSERNEAQHRAVRYSRFQRLVNMRPREMREHFESSELAALLAASRRSKTAAIREGREAARWIKRLKETPVEAWTPELWEWCDRVTRFIERLRKNGAPLLAEGGRATRKLQALRSWGHDPLRESFVEAADVRELLTLEPRALGMRLLDASSTDGPVQIVEAVKAPAFKLLKSGCESLTDEERAECLQEKAVWHPTGRDACSAVWKADVAGATWYVSNTHRAYAASRTLDGAIKRFHSFVKTTA